MGMDDATNDPTPAEPTAFDAPMFMAMPSFTADWERADLTDADLIRLQVLLGENPTAGPVMGGTGGLRKVRFAPEGKGKSGAVRVCYATFAVVGGVVVLYALFEKSEKANLSKEEKNAAAKVLRGVEDAIREYDADRGPDPFFDRFRIA